MAEATAQRHIELGALTPSIEEQLSRMGLVQTGRKSVELLDRIASAVTLCHIHGCLTDSECDRARKRLVKQLRLRDAADAVVRAHSENVEAK